MRPAGWHGRSRGREPVHRQAGTEGFTLVELLLASAILVLILVALTSYLTTSVRAYETTEDLSDRQQEIEAAVNVLSYDLALAGYRGTTPSQQGRTFSGPTLEVVKAADPADSDTLRLRYFEDDRRLFGSDPPCGTASDCLVTYEVGPDEDGEGTFLLRREGTSTERGIVQAVEYFHVREYLDRDGSFETITAGTELPDDVAGLNVEIAFTNGGLWRFPVAVSNLQSLD